MLKWKQHHLEFKAKVALEALKGKENLNWRPGYLYLVAIMDWHTRKVKEGPLHTVSIIFVPFLIWLAIWQMFGMLWADGFLVACGIAALLRNRILQQKRNQFASQVLLDLESEQHPTNFALCLRPFRSDKFHRKPKLAAVSVVFGGFGFTSVAQDTGRSVTFEGKLTLDVKTQLGLDLIGFTAPDEELFSADSFGHSKVLKNWKETVEKAIDKAAVIIIFPSSSEGTKHELNRIFAFQSRLEKTIFVLTPIVKNILDDGAESLKEAADHWGIGHKFDVATLTNEGGSVICMKDNSVSLTNTLPNDDSSTISEIIYAAKRIFS